MYVLFFEIIIIITSWLTCLPTSQHCFHQLFQGVWRWRLACRRWLSVAPVRLSLHASFYVRNSNRVTVFMVSSSDWHHSWVKGRYGGLYRSNINLIKLCKSKQNHQCDNLGNFQLLRSCWADSLLIKSHNFTTSPLFCPSAGSHYLGGRLYCSQRSHSPVS